MIDSMFQAGTDAALDDQVQRPAPFKPDEPKFGFGQVAKAPFQGVASGATKSAAFGAEIAGAFGDVMGAGGFNAGGMFSAPTPEERKQQTEASRRLLELGPQFSNPAGDLFRARAKEMMPDPTQTHAAAQLVAGVAEFATQAVGYAALGGPAGPALLAGDASLAESDKLKQEGVPLGARSAAGAVAGVVAGVSVALPVVGKTAAQTVGLVAAGGPGGFIAQNVAEKAILQAAGYNKLADQYDPLDPVGLALSSVVPAAFGAFAHGARLRADAKTGRKSEAEQLRPQAALTTAEQARSDAYERSDANLTELRQAIKQEKNPEARAALQEELGKQTKAAEQNRTADAARAAVAVDPDVVAAARVRQTAAAVDSFRLTPDGDLAGMTRHTDAIESAHEMLARGERVEVSNIVTQPEALPPLVVGEPVQVALRSGETLTVERQDAANLPEYVARNAAGEEVGTVRFNPAREADVQVPAQFQRQGIASALMDATERSTGVTRAPARTPEGQAFQQARAARQIDRPAALVAGLRKAFEPPPQPRAAATPLRASPTKEGSTDIKASAAARPPTKEGASTPDAKQAAALDAQTAEINAIDPDMMVQIEGREPMKVSELLEQIKAEAKEDAQEASFVETAVNCLLRNE